MSLFVVPQVVRPRSARVGDARHHNLPGDSDFVQRVPQRPARFRVVDDPGWDKLARRYKSTWVRKSFYVGRLIAGAEHTAELWEVPSGRACMMRLDEKNRINKRKGWSPIPGDRVRVWAWEEPYQGQFRTRLVWAASAIKLSHEQKQHIRALLGSDLAEI